MKFRTVLAMGIVVTGTLACCGVFDLDGLDIDDFEDVDGFDLGDLDLDMYQSFELSPGFGPEPQIGAGRSGGLRDATDLGESEFGPCVGNIDLSPDHQLVLTDDFEDLRIEASSDGDTSLVIKGPDGVRCNDDDVGLDPGIQGAWSAGSYEIYVGSESPGNHAYELRIIENPG